MPTSTVRQVIGDETSDDERLRIEWGQSLQRAMEFRRINSERLSRRLTDMGYPVTRQAVDYWRSGKSAPRPLMQRAIGAALDLHPRDIFDLEPLPKAG